MTRNFKFSVDLLMYTGNFFMENVFAIKSTEGLKSQYKARIRLLSGANPQPLEPSARFSFLTAKTSSLIL